MMGQVLAGRRKMAPLSVCSKADLNAISTVRFLRGSQPANNFSFQVPVQEFLKSRDRYDARKLLPKEGDWSCFVP